MSEERGQQMRNISAKHEQSRKGDLAPKKRIIGKMPHLRKWVLQQMIERRKASIVSGRSNWRDVRGRANLRKRKWLRMDPE